MLTYWYMGQFGDAIVQFPVSGSTVPPSVHVRVAEQCSSASLYITAATSSAVQVLPANPNRRKAIYINSSPNYAYLGYGYLPNSAQFSEIAPSVDRKTTTVGHYDSTLPVYTGPVYAVWDTTNAQSGSMYFTDFSS